MPSFVLTQKAKADLKAIGRYTGDRWGREQRNRYLAMLDKSFHELAENPAGKGRDCGDIRPGYRKHRAGQHVIYYRPVDAGCIEIVRVLHGRMDAERHLPESG
jgi:toxin ParE1/3/4